MLAAILFGLNSLRFTSVSFTITPKPRITPHLHLALCIILSYLILFCFNLEFLTSATKMLLIRPLNPLPFLKKVLSWIRCDSWLLEAVYLFVPNILYISVLYCRCVRIFLSDITRFATDPYQYCPWLAVLCSHSNQMCRAVDCRHLMLEWKRSARSQNQLREWR